MRTKKKEEEFVKAHESRFNAALAKATMSVRQDARFVGLNKIREPLAYRAALKATGYPDADAFAVPKEAGEPNVGVQEACDQAFEAAVEAARS